MADPYGYERTLSRYVVEGMIEKKGDGGLVKGFL